MTFLDACALIAVIQGEPAMNRVLAILREGPAAMTATNVSEVFDVVARRADTGYTRIADVVEPLFEGHLALVSVDLGLARRAAELGPHPIRKQELRVGAFPQQEVTQALLAAGAYEQIDVRSIAEQP